MGQSNVLYHNFGMVKATFNCGVAGNSLYLDLLVTNLYTTRLEATKQKYISFKKVASNKKKWDEKQIRLRLENTFNALSYLNPAHDISISYQVSVRLFDI